MRSPCCVITMRCSSSAFLNCTVSSSRLSRPELRASVFTPSQAVPNVDAEGVAAHVPSIIQFADEMGASAGRGTLQTAVLEHARGLAVISCVSPDAVLLVLVQPTANLGQLLYELRRNRASIAALV